MTTASSEQEESIFFSGWELKFSTLDPTISLYRIDFYLPEGKKFSTSSGAEPRRLSFQLSLFRTEDYPQLLDFLCPCCFSNSEPIGFDLAQAVGFDCGLCGASNSRGSMVHSPRPNEAARWLSELLVEFDLFGNLDSVIAAAELLELVQSFAQEVEKAIPNAASLGWIQPKAEGLAKKWSRRL